MTHTTASNDGQRRLPPHRSPVRPRSAAGRASAAQRRREPELRASRAAGPGRAPLRRAPGAAGTGPETDGTVLTEPLSVARNPWEWPLTAAAFAVTACVLALAVHTLLTAEGMAWWVAALVLAGLPGGCWVRRGLLLAEQRAQSVRISPTQFPEAEHAIRRMSAQMGLSSAPDAYVCPSTGRLRAWASGHGTRSYIVISSDLFEFGGSLRDPAALRFLVAHQLGHIAAGHTSYLLRAGTAAGRLVPVLGASLSRAMEYTADNHAHAHCPEGVHAVRLLAGGGHLYPQVNMSEMAERARTDRGPFLFLYNLLSSRPSNTRRMAAIRDRTRPGQVFL
ncbi:M48 family metallopeptidase [Streptomonospora sediminis]